MIRFVVIESLLVGGLLLVAGYSLARMLVGLADMDGFRGLPFGIDGQAGLGDTLKTVLIVGSIGVAVGGYWALQIAGWTRWAFWSVTLVALVLQAPSIWSHNRLDWLAFGEVSSLSPGLSQTAAVGVFLLSLVFLVTLHRIGELRRFESKLAGMNLEPRDRRQVMAGEWVTLIGLVAAGVLVTVILLTAGMALGQMDQLFEKSPWTVASVGGTAVVLLSAFVSLWLRTRGTG